MTEQPPKRPQMLAALAALSPDKARAILAEHGYEDAGDVSRGHVEAILKDALDAPAVTDRLTLDDLAERKRWVAWQNEDRKGKANKTPYSPHGRNRKARADDPSTWGTRAEAEARFKTLPNPLGKGGIGIELGPHDRLALGGIDLDTCLKDGKFEPWAAEVIERFASYTEVSPSGTGAKIFFAYDEHHLTTLREAMGTDHSKAWKAEHSEGVHAPGIELHLGNRYFTVTEQHLSSTPADLRTIPLEALLWLVGTAGPNFAPVKSAKKTKGERRAAADGPVDPEALQSKIAKACAAYPKLAQRWNGDFADLADQSRSGKAMSLVSLLRRSEFTFAEVTAAIASHPATTEWAAENMDGRQLQRMWDAADAAATDFEPEESDGLRARVYLELGSDQEIAESIAKAIKRKFGEVVFDEGEFWIYGSTHWVVLEKERLFKHIAHTYDGAISKTLGSYTKITKQRRESILALLITELRTKEFFKDTPDGINCASGFIRFDRDGRPSLDRHSAAHRQRACLPGKWSSDPDWMPPNTLFATLLRGYFKECDPQDRSDKVALIQEMMGAAAGGYSTKLAHPKAIILVGQRAGEGKSQLITAFPGLVPAEATSHVPPNKWNTDSAVVRMVGMLLNTSNELGDDRTISSDQFKKVVTGDMTEARDLYDPMIFFKPVALQIFACNDLPVFTGGMDNGVRRRLLPIEFTRKIPEEEAIPEIGDRIAREESDALLDFAVAGLSRLIKRGRYTEPLSSRKLLVQWIKKNDAVAAWAEDCLEFDEGGRIEKGLAYDHFFSYASVELGFKQHHLPGKPRFVDRVLRLDPKIDDVKSTGNVKLFTGIKLKGAAD